MGLSSVNIKKALRTAQVQFPALVEAKFAFHHRFFKSTGMLYKSDYGGLRHFDLAGKLLLDVGANRGQSIVAFKNAVKSPRIIAFEPNPRLAANLVERYRDDPDVSVLDLALCAVEREFTLHIPYYRDFMLDGLASLKLEDRYVDLLGERVARATGAALLVAHAPRAMIDLNRAIEDIDWEMFGERESDVGSYTPGRRARSGLGLIPRRLPGVGELWKRRHE